MNLTTQRRLIHAATATFAAVALGGVGWSLGSIQSASRSTDSNPTAAPVIRSVNDPSENDANSNGPSVDFGTPMQESLYDRPKPAPKPPPRKVVPPPTRKTTPAPSRKPKLDWTLVGTIMDGEGSLAILSDAAGKVDIRRVGETVELQPGGVLVKSIDDQAVTLEIAGTPSILKLKQNFASASRPGARGRGNRPR